MKLSFWRELPKTHTTSGFETSERNWLKRSVLQAFSACVSTMSHVIVTEGLIGIVLITDLALSAGNCKSGSLRLSAV